MSLELSNLHYAPGDQGQLTSRPDRLAYVSGSDPELAELLGDPWPIGNDPLNVIMGRVIGRDLPGLCVVAPSDSGFQLVRFGLLTVRLENDSGVALHSGTSWQTIPLAGSTRLIVGQAADIPLGVADGAVGANGFTVDLPSTPGRRAADLTPEPTAVVGRPGAVVARLTFEGGTSIGIDQDVVLGPGAEADERVVSGRARAAVVPGDLDSVDGVKADLQLTESGVILTDRGSSEGTYVWSSGAATWLRLERGQSVGLVDEDRLAFGPLLARFELLASPLDQPVAGEQG